MKFQVGQLVRPVKFRHRHQGGTLAIVLAESFGDVRIRWLNGRAAGSETFDYTDVFEVLSGK
mgnify:CR=1 FL=1